MPASPAGGWGLCSLSCLSDGFALGQPSFSPHPSCGQWLGSGGVSGSWVVFFFSCKWTGSYEDWTGDLASISTRLSSLELTSPDELNTLWCVLCRVLKAALFKLLRARPHRTPQVHSHTLFCCDLGSLGIFVECSLLGEAREKKRMRLCPDMDKEMHKGQPVLPPAMLRSKM